LGGQHQKLHWCERGSSDCTSREEMLSQNICNVDVRGAKKTNTKINVTTKKTKTKKNSLKESIIDHPFGEIGVLTKLFFVREVSGC